MIKLTARQSSKIYSTWAPAMALRSELAFSETANLSSSLTNRLSHLHLADNEHFGISSGDDQLNYGAWVLGAIGKGLFKDKDFGKIKQHLSGATIGFDGKIDDDTNFRCCFKLQHQYLKTKSRF
jgi:hypothetical protein